MSELANLPPLTEMFERHRAENPDHNGRTFCERCFQAWPCDATIFGDAWQGVLADLAALRTAIDDAWATTTATMQPGPAEDGRE